MHSWLLLYRISCSPRSSLFGLWWSYQNLLSGLFWTRCYFSTIQCIFSSLHLSREIPFLCVYILTSFRRCEALLHSLLTLAGPLKVDHRSWLHEENTTVSPWLVCVPDLLFLPTLTAASCHLWFHHFLFCFFPFSFTVYEDLRCLIPELFES